MVSRRLPWRIVGKIAGAAGSLMLVTSCISFSPLESAQNLMNSPETDIRCLDGSAPVILDYWEGNLQDLNALHGLWNCAAKAVHVFETRVRGAQPGVYTADEVRTLVAKFFLPGARITDRLLAGTMKMKAAFLGGPTDRVTSAEIQKIQDWIELFHQQSVKVYPYIGHFVGRVYLTDQSVLDAANAVMELALSMGQELQKNGISLEFETVREVLDELSRFVESPELGRNLVDLRDRIVLVEMIKNDLVGGTPGQISGGDWVEVFRKIAQTAHWYLKSKQLDQEA